ncbi:MAG TPA: sugar phosphate nucleotidyltransferase [Acidimicrobiales bacterium]|nr:sugar phosphate nucleotidyltransferase [Acidimicrobiales bacterium]
MRPDEIPIVILCGGLGTRLREATESLPKPMVDIGGRPILWHIMKAYSEHGFRRFVLPLGYKGWDIKEYFLRYRENLADFTVRLGDGIPVEFHNRQGCDDWEVTCVETGLLTGTGARIARVAEHLDTEVFGVTYGDGIGDVDLGRELDFHQSHDAVGTVVGVQPTSRYGEMSVSDDRVLGFNEKPDTTEGFVSGGFFFFRHRFLDYLPTDDPELLLEREPLSKLASDGELRVFPHRGFWMGMDTYREYTALNSMWEMGEAPWKTWSDA